MTATTAPGEVHDAAFTDTTPNVGSNGTGAIAVRDGGSMTITWTPRFILPVDEMKAGLEQKRQFFKAVLREGEHYGKVPGAGDKPALFKAGAEVLCANMALHPEIYDERPPVVDFDGETTKSGEPLIRYVKRCDLFYQTGPKVDDRIKVASSEGSCSSREVKYRYRIAQRKCPVCGAETIKKSKPPRTGFYCFEKIGGCGEQFNADDRRITDQKLGRVLNPDVAELDNTIGKMAGKRAFVGTALYGTGCSDIFTQDIEDGAPSPDGGMKNVTPQKQQIEDDTARHLFAILRDIGVTTGPKEELKPKRLAWAARFGYKIETFKDLAEEDGQRLIAIAEAVRSAQQAAPASDASAPAQQSTREAVAPNSDGASATEYCDVCRVTGGHEPGCPEDPNPRDGVHDDAGDIDDSLDDADGIDHMVNHSDSNGAVLSTVKLRTLASIVDGKRIRPARLESLLRTATAGRATELVYILDADVGSVLAALQAEPNAK